MIWLIGTLFILQSFFYWFLKPAILIITPIVELRGLGLLALALFAWLLAGRVEGER